MRAVFPEDMLSEIQSKIKGINRRQIVDFAVCLLAVVFRLYRLADLPHGLHVDEAGMAYDAYAILHYGVDRYLHSFPVYLINYGGGQSVLYAYLCVAVMRWTGISVWAVRLPGVFGSILTLIFGTKIMRRICGEDAAEVRIFQFFFLIWPVFLMSGRFGLDCNLMLGVFTLFLWRLIRAVDENSRPNWLIAGITGGLVLYTYAISYVFMPLFLLCVLVLLLIHKKLKVVDVLCFVPPLLLFALPLLIVQWVNMTGHPSVQFGDITMPSLGFYRGSEIRIPSVSGFLRTLKSIFLFDQLDYNSMPRFGNLYYISIPLFLAGLAVLVKKLRTSLKERTFDPSVFFLFAFFAFLIVGSTLGGDGANVNKCNVAFLSVACTSAIGAGWIIKKIPGKAGRVFAVAGAILYAVLAVLFFHAYFVEQEQEPQRYLFQQSMKEPFAFIENTEEFNDRAVYVVHYHQPSVSPYIYYLLANEVSPFAFDMADPNVYGRYIFHGPDEIDDDQSVYLVFDGNEGATEELAAIGVDRHVDFDGYSVWYSGAVFPGVDEDKAMTDAGEEEAQKGLYFGHDLPFHLRRIAGLAEELKDGQFPVRMQRFWFNDYGYPVSVMYGDALLYFPAVLHLCGVPLWLSYLIYMIIIQIATALAAYACFKYLSGSARTGLLCMLLYMLSLWRLADLFTREAAGEVSAFAFFPLLVMGFVMLKRGERKPAVVAWIAAGMTGLFMTHLLSVVMALLFIVLYVLLHIRAVCRDRGWMLLLSSAGVTLFVNLWQFVPLVDYYLHVPMVVNSAEVQPIQTYGAEFPQLLGLLYSTTGAMGELGVPVYEEIPQSTGLALLLAMAAGFVAIVIRIAQKKPWRELLLPFVFGGVSLFFASCHMPYDRLLAAAPELFKLIGSVQFPARYLTAATVFICSLVAVMFQKEEEQTNRNRQILALCLLVLAVWQGGGYIISFMSDQTQRVDAVDVQVLGSFDDDRQYMIVGTDVDRLQYRSILPSEHVTVSEGTAEGHTFVFSAENTGANAGTADLPLLAYPYYRAYDGNGLQLPVDTGENNRLRVTVPAGFSGQVSVRWQAPVLWQTAAVLTLAAVLALIAYLIYGKTKRRTGENV